MGYSLYDTFTIEEAQNIGKKFIVKCKSNLGYEGKLTEGKIYQIEIIDRILPMSPLCKLIGDNGKEVACHLHRFEKDQI